MTPHDTPLPAWVSVDQLGSWDDLVQEVEQLWPDVVAEASQAQQFLERDPVRVLALVALRHEFQTLVAQMHTALDLEAWARVPTRELVALLRRFVSTLAGIHCLAASRPPVGPTSEIVQFYEMLLIRGLVKKAGGVLRDDEDSLDIARFLAISHLTIPWVAHELVERGKEHKPGVAAAILLGLPKISDTPELHVAEQWAFNYLMERIWKAFPGAIRDPLDQERADPDLGSQILLTLNEPRWRGPEPFERLVNALKGRMDVAPRSVRDRLTRPRKTRDKGQELTLGFSEQSPKLGDETEVVEPTDRSAVSDERMKRRDAWQAISARCKRNPKFHAYLRARQDTTTQKDAALTAGISVPTARSYDQELRAILASHPTKR